MLVYIDRFLRDYDPQVTGRRCNLEQWTIRTADYVTPGTYKWREQEPRPFRVGEPWGTPGTTAFLRRVVEIPAEWAGLRVGLVLVAGGEGLVRVNGQPHHGLDGNRWYVPLAKQAVAGERYDVEIELFHPVPVPQDHLNNQRGAPPRAPLSFSKAQLLAADTELDELWYTIKVYREAAAMLPESNPYRARMLGVLGHTVGQLEGLDLAGQDRGAIEGAQEALHELAEFMEKGQLPGRLVAIGQSHIDVAWLWPVKETVRKCSRTFSTALALMEEYPDFIFTQSQPILYQFVKEQYPELYERIRARVKEGRWEIVGGMYVEPDLNLSSGEALVRQVLFSQRFWESEFGRRATVEWLPDTFGYCASLPQILKKAGLDYFMTVKLYWNDTNRFPHNLFWWQGIDGTRVMAYLNHGLNEPATPGTLQQHWAAFREQELHPEAMYLYGHGDGGGGVTREMLEYIARSEALPGLPEVRIGKASDYFADITAAEPELPVWYGDLYLEKHRGTYTAQAQVKRDNRRSELLLREAEIWSVFARRLGHAYPAAAIRQAWEKTLLNQFHDILPGSSIPEVYHDAAQVYGEIFASGEQVRGDALTCITGAVDTRGPGRPIVVLNSLPWERTDVVRLPYVEGQVAVLDAEGRCLPTQLVTGLDGQTELWFLAERVPSLGYQTYWWGEEAGPDCGCATAQALVPQSLPASWETERLVVGFDDQGQIVRLYDKQNEREVLPAGAVANQLQLFTDRPTNWDAWEIDARYPGSSFQAAQLAESGVVSQGPICDVIRFSWSIGGSRVDQDLVLYHHDQRLEFRTHVDWQEKHRMLKVAFPVDVLSPLATFEIPFGSVQRATHSNTSWEEAQYEVCAHKWADLSETAYGVSLLNDCKYGHEIKGQTMKLTLLRAPGYPDPHADEGEHDFIYALYPHAGSWCQAGTVRAGYALNVPLRAVETETHAGSLPNRAAFVEVDAEHVVLDTVKWAEDGSGLVLRFYEAHGARGTVGVRLPWPVARVASCDLLEEEEQPVALADAHSFRFDTKPYEITTLKVVLA